MNLQNTTALVTGGANRVGLSISLALARAGADVIVHYHNSEAEARAAGAQIEALGRRAFLVRADVADAEQVQDMLTMIERECPPVDVLVNSASVFYATPLESATTEQWDENLNVNLRAPFLLAQSLGLKMVERGRGKIVNITDCSIRRPYLNYAPYLVSKTGLVALTEVLALELAPHVQVNAVAPGTVLLPESEVPGQREQSIRRAPLKRIGNPADVASMVVYLVEHGDFMTGGYYPVDGGAGSR
jgi:NAD(P)-dependent dehydrogenase (short-subunit alcohol dehydrogenase family)